MASRKLQARVRNRVSLHEGFLKVYRYEFEVERYAGGTATLEWELMERGDAVAVLGHDPQRNEVVLVQEFRPGPLLREDYPFRDNLVAGAIEPGESPLAAAVRETPSSRTMPTTGPPRALPRDNSTKGSGRSSTRIVASTASST